MKKKSGDTTRPAKRAANTQMAFRRKHGRRAFTIFMVSSRQLGMVGGFDPRSMRIHDMPDDLNPNHCVQLALRLLNLKARGLGDAVKEVEALRAQVETLEATIKSLRQKRRAKKRPQK